MTYRLVGFCRLPLLFSVSILCLIHGWFNYNCINTSNNMCQSLASCLDRLWSCYHPRAGHPIVLLLCINRIYWLLFIFSINSSLSCFWGLFTSIHIEIFISHIYILSSNSWLEPWSSSLFIILSKALSLNGCLFSPDFDYPCKIFSTLTYSRPENDLGPSIFLRLFPFPSFKPFPLSPFWFFQFRNFKFNNN